MIIILKFEFSLISFLLYFKRIRELLVCGQLCPKPCLLCRGTRPSLQHSLSQQATLQATLLLLHVDPLVDCERCLYRQGKIRSPATIPTSLRSLSACTPPGAARSLTLQLPFLAGDYLFSSPRGIWENRREPLTSLVCTYSRLVEPCSV